MILVALEGVDWERVDGFVRTMVVCWNAIVRGCWNHHQQLVRSKEAARRRSFSSFEGDRDPEGWLKDADSFNVIGKKQRQRVN